MAAEARRRIPSIDALLRSAPGRRASASFGRALVKSCLAATLGEVRAAAAARGTASPPDEEILARAIGRAADAALGLDRVINATGVILHTGLGRAPLPEDAARAAAEVAVGYSDLEVDRASGRRGRRSTRAERLLIALTGAEDALVVNNGAAGVLLLLAALARGKQVLVSRGELIEIGGEFRIPDIMSASGAKLVEVGTTNRTRAKDFRAALTERTALILKVHPSNYRVVGFTAEPTARELSDVARSAGVPFAYDLGSGLLDRPRGFPADEPTVAEALGAGADVVVCSGDKLLGGPQAGLVLGRADTIERLRRHPVARAVRVDKLQLAALERVLAAYAAGRHDDVPVRRMLTERPADVRRRAERLAETLDREDARVLPSTATVGGGSMPGHELASFGVELAVPEPNATAARLRTGTPPVFCRVTEVGVAFDVRTVAEDDVADLARAIGYALEGGAPSLPA
ncbi:MAG TPA: L-seryl-tRNA(Sec) selenium transferase [Actinomycetota bacterium]|nr:L-seryl-tRNA(Sec) selenium transferase [Actinomycetota bacterium]